MPTIQQTKLGLKVEFPTGLGFWVIPTENRVSVFCEKGSSDDELIDRSFWTQNTNASTLQRSLEMRS